MYRRLWLLLLVVVMGLTAVVSAQEIIPNPNDTVNLNANISWPPPVYVLRGRVEIHGTANIPNMSNYFLEFRPLYEESTVAGQEGVLILRAEESPWFPITLPSSTPVTENALGTWNTQTTADGLYEMRLTVNVSGQTATNFVVSPIRVENEVPAFVDLTQQGTTGQPAVVTATQSVQTRPTLAPSATPFDTTPRVTATTNANVRSGDDTVYDVVGVLRNNTSATVIGISSTGSGWYYIRTDDGTVGWIAPSVVTATGDFRNVGYMSPPPRPATNTPVPPTVPPASGNLAASPPSLTPNPPTCNVAFQVFVNITNNGSAATTGPATIRIQDIHVATGTVQATFDQAVPALAVGQNYVVGTNAFIVSTYYNEEHRIVVTLDPEGARSETNENDNVVSTTYTLQKGGC